MAEIALPSPESRASTASVILGGEADSLLDEFLAESREGLDQIDRDLLALEQDPSDRATLDRIFRCIHTIKGTCGFFGFSRLETITHAAESLLSRLRDGEIGLGSEVSSALLAAVDAVREILVRIAAVRDEGPGDYQLLIDALVRLCEPGDPHAADAEGIPAELPRFGEILLQSGRVKPEALAAALRAQAGGDTRFLGEILIEAGAVHPEEVADALRLQEESRFQAIWDNTIRIEIRWIDRLTELVGELAATRSQLLQLAAAQEDTALRAATTRLSRITTELQEGVTKTRLQPLGSLWSRLPRAVRELALTCRKQVRLEMTGEEIRLGREVIEAIKDPLLHLVRNAVDHGIGTPEERLRRGKPPEGHLRLHASVEEGHVVIELTDDGAGIDAERIRERAVERRLITAQQAAEMPPEELVNLIFLPGFSTARQVSAISGRGVGMDVVKTNVEKIGGSLQVESQPGQGTTIRLRVPLNL